MTTPIKRTLLWMMGGRVAAVTLLLGSAVLIQIHAPGTFPVDPFFAKDGAGTLLKIKVDGTSREPKFGLDRGRKAD